MLLVIFAAVIVEVLAGTFLLLFLLLRQVHGLDVREAGFAQRAPRLDLSPTLDARQAEEMRTAVDLPAHGDVLLADGAHVAEDDIFRRRHGCCRRRRRRRR